MSFIHAMKVRNRLLVVSMVAFLAFGAVVWEAISSLGEVILEERETKTKALVETAHTVLGHFHAMEASGAVSREEAQKQALATIKSLRYEGSEYFWINDMGPRMVMHPIKPELDGKDLSDFRDPKGKRLFVEFVDTVKKGGEGYVDYLWPKPGMSEPQPKVSFVKGFAPWGWVIGSGVYGSDVNALFWHHGSHTLVLGGLGLLLIMAAAWAVARSILVQLGGEPDYAMAVATRIAEGDLATTVKLAPNDRASVLHAMSQMESGLRTIVHQIRDAADAMGQAVREAAATAEAVREASHRQSEAASSTAAAIEQMSVSIAHVSDSTGETRNAQQAAGDAAARGEELASQASGGIGAVRDTVSTAADRIQRLKDQSNQIGSIASVIREIAEQTNLLALNAAIEAARAGEQGRGFAVVADEVRKLAERTGKATAEISHLIESVQQETESAVLAIEEIGPAVDRGSEMSLQAGEALRGINRSTHDTLARLGDVVSSMRELSVASTSVAGNMQQISEMAESNGAQANRSAETAAALGASAAALRESVGRFRLG